MIERPPPHSLEAETGVLGAVMLDNSLWHTVSHLQPEDFYRTGHNIVFAVMAGLVKDNIPVDTVTLVTRLREQNTLERAGGAAYIASLTGAVPSLAHAAKYAVIVSQTARKRRVIQAAMQLADEVREQDTDEALSTFDANTTDRAPAGVSTKISEGLTEVLEELERLSRGELPPTIPTGFPDLDTACPICQNDLVVLAGRPGMGKTAAALNIGINASLAGFPVLFVSAEMAKNQIIQRAVSMLGNLDGSKFRRGGIKDKDFDGINRAMTKLQGIPFWIFSGGTLTATRICSEIARVVRAHGVKLVIVDHIHQIAGKGTEFEVISATSEALRSAAVDTNTAIIALSQLNRNVESRMPPKPNMGDLRQTGKIEEVAASVLMIYRQDYYEKKGFFDDKKARAHLHEEYRGAGLITVDKSRFGPQGYAILDWDGKTTSFRNREWRQ